MENKKITSHQLYTLTATVSLGGTILVIASTVAGIAKQDAWISAFIAPAYGLLVMLTYYYLGSCYPGMTLIGMLNKIFGKWGGRVVAIAYVFLFLVTAMQLPWYIGNFMGRMMHETPVYVINSVFVAAAIIGILYGIEAIARASEFFIKLVSVLFIASVLLMMNKVKIDYSLPVLEEGIIPVLKGSYFISCYITFSVVIILMIYPRHVSEIKQAKKAMMKGLLWSGAVTFITILMSILVLGSALSARASFPSLMLIQEIEAAGIITRLEYIISIIWIVTQFMVSSLFIYSAITAFSEVLGLKEHKYIVLPMGLIILLMSGIVYPSSVYQANWDNMVYAPYITTFGLIIPVLMVFVYFIKKRFFNIR